MTNLSKEYNDHQQHEGNKRRLFLTTIPPVVISLLVNMKESVAQNLVSQGREIELPRVIEVREPMDYQSQRMIEAWEEIYKGDRFNYKKLTAVIGYPRKRIEYIEQNQNHVQIKEAILRAQDYYSYMVEIFRQNRVPAELVDIIFAESHFQYTITSFAGARGPFQFMPATARMYDLHLSSDGCIDERCDPLKSADAACRLLKNLHASYQTSPDAWLWALLAYNRGPGSVNRLFKQCRGSFAKYYLTTNNNESRNYVPKFFGIRRVKEKLSLEIKDKTIVKEFDVVELAYKRKPDFEVTVQRGDTLFSIAKKLKVTVSDIKRWNNLSSNIVGVGKRLAIGDGKIPSVQTICSSMRITSSALLELNPAIMTKVVELKRYTLPQGFHLRLPHGKGKEFVALHGDSLRDGANTSVSEFRDIRTKRDEIVKTTRLDFFRKILG